MTKPSFTGSLGERLRIPGEALGELKLSALENRRVLIENHKGLLHCSEELISVRGAGMSLHVFGADLRIEAMNGSDLLLSGRLERIEWQGGEEA